MNYLELNLIGRGASEGHHNVHTGFVTNGHTVQIFKYYRQTHKDKRTA